MAAPNEQSEAPSTAPAAMTTERELLREALEGIDDHWITLPEGVAWKKKVNALLALPATQRSGLPDAWLEIDHGQVIGVSIEKDLRSPFKWVPLYAAPISETEAMTALRYIELECRDRPEAVMQKIHKLAAAALWSGNNGSVT